MTDRFNRRPKNVPIRDLPRGPNGRALCRGCGKEVPKGKISWCSQACIDARLVISDTAHQAKLVEDRDHGICGVCGLDCIGLFRELEELRLHETEALMMTHRMVYCCHTTWRWGRCGHGPCRLDGARNIISRWLPVGPELQVRCRAVGLPESHWNLARRLWEIDHIVPVVEGGGSCGLENLRTLCVVCHRQETRKLAKRRSKRNRRDPP
jgi:5-methylcytosine-specific restriction protein A